MLQTSIIVMTVIIAVVLCLQSGELEHEYSMLSESQQMRVYNDHSYNYYAAIALV